LTAELKVGIIPTEMKPVRCATTQEAVDLLHHCLEQGSVRLGRHFRDELAAEHLDFEDAWAVMRSGTINEPQEVDIGTGEEKWKVEGNEPGGKWLAIVFCFKAIDNAFLITVYSVDKGR
jgi:hypothetical protein